MLRPRIGKFSAYPYIVRLPGHLPQEPMFFFANYHDNKMNGVDRVTVEQSVIGHRSDVPFWRELSTRGMLQDDPFHCPKAYQQKMLEGEGLTIVPCGAYNKSLKVDNYRNFLFDFDTLHIQKEELR